jgi:hypothetical protein
MVLALAWGAGAFAPAVAQEADPPADDRAVPSDAASQVIAWVSRSGDNGGLPFIVIDKLAAEIFVFDGGGALMAAAPALLGSAPGDESVEGVGDRELSAIAPEERTTPAGRFVAGYGYANGQRKVLWVDYATAISLHPVVSANRKEQRLARLYSPEADDNRITYGCINIAAAFYENLVRPLFADTRGIVYILPDTKPLDEVFPALAAPVQAQASLARDGAP